MALDPGTVTLVSLIINAFAALAAPFVARKLASNQAEMRQAEKTLKQLATTIGVIERAVDDLKTEDGDGPGNEIADAIREYGPSAKALVDAGRQAAATLRRQLPAALDPDYEAAMIAREIAEHDARVARGEIPGVRVVRPQD